MLSLHRRLFLVVALFSLDFCLNAPLLGQVKQVRVTTEWATISTEPHQRSTKIEILKKGTVLDLFQKNKIKGGWYYVRFYSPRYRGPASGFIHESSVEPVGAGTKPIPAREVEKKPEPAKKAEKEEPNPPEVPKEVEQKRKIEVEVRKKSFEEPRFHLYHGTLEIGFTSVSNLFQEYGPANPDSTTCISGDLEAKIDLSRRLTLFPRIAFKFNKYFGYSTASYPQILAGLEIRQGTHGFSLEWMKRTHRLLYISSSLGEIIYDSQKINISYKGGFLQSTTFTLEYEWEGEKYMKNEDSRSMNSHGLGFKVSAKLSSFIVSHTGLEWRSERARDMNYSLDRAEPWAAVRLRFPLNLQVYTRYKITLKDYTTVLPDDTNFNRQDTYHNLLVELKIPLGKNIYLVAKDFYRKGLSTRLNRNFSNNEISVIMAFAF